MKKKKKLSRRGLSLGIERHLENNLCGGIVVIKGELQWKMFFRGRNWTAEMQQAVLSRPGLSSLSYQREPLMAKICFYFVHCQIYLKLVVIYIFDSKGL